MGLRSLLNRSRDDLKKPKSKSYWGYQLSIKAVNVKDLSKKANLLPSERRALLHELTETEKTEKVLILRNKNKKLGRFTTSQIKEMLDDIGFNIDTVLGKKHKADLCAVMSIKGTLIPGSRVDVWQAGPVNPSTGLPEMPYFAGHPQWEINKHGELVPVKRPLRLGGTAGSDVVMTLFHGKEHQGVTGSLTEIGTLVDIESKRFMEGYGLRYEQDSQFGLFKDLLSRFTNSMYVRGLDDATGRLRYPVHENVDARKYSIMTGMLVKRLPFQDSALGLSRQVDIDVLMFMNDRISERTVRKIAEPAKRILGIKTFEDINPISEGHTLIIPKGTPKTCGKSLQQILQLSIWLPRRLSMRLKRP